MAAKKIINLVIDLDPYYKELRNSDGKRLLKDIYVTINILHHAIECTLASIYPHIGQYLHQEKAKVLVAFLQQVTLAKKGINLVLFRVAAPIEERISLYSGITQYTIWQQCKLNEENTKYAFDSVQLPIF